MASCWVPTVWLLAAVHDRVVYCIVLYCMVWYCCVCVCVCALPCGRPQQLVLFGRRGLTGARLAIPGLTRVAEGSREGLQPAL